MAAPIVVVIMRLVYSIAHALNYLTTQRLYNPTNLYIEQAGHLIGPLPDGSYRKGEWVGAFFFSLFGGRWAVARFALFCGV